MWGSSKPVVNNEIIKLPTRKTVFVSLDPNSENEVFYEISNVNFTPDVMIVKSITVINAGTADAVYRIITDLTDWQPIAIINTKSVEINLIDVTFNLNKQINGTYTFRFTDYIGDSVNLSMFLTLQLEFIKY